MPDFLLGEAPSVAGVAPVLDPGENRRLLAAVLHFGLAAPLRVNDLAVPVRPAGIRLLHARGDLLHLGLALLAGPLLDLRVRGEGVAPLAVGAVLHFRQVALLFP